MEGMKIFTVKRTHFTSMGVFGVLDCEGEPFAVTCENSQLYIPKGEYVCKKAFFNRKGYWTFEITSVPGRDHILIHKGNTEGDSAGCILVGENFGILKGRTAILDSKGGFEEFMSRTHDADSFKLIIE